MSNTHKQDQLSSLVHNGNHHQRTSQSRSFSSIYPEIYDLSSKQIVILDFWGNPGPLLVSAIFSRSQCGRWAAVAAAIFLFLAQCSRRTAVAASAAGLC
jgi:hypothetical protein